MITCTCTHEPAEHEQLPANARLGACAVTRVSFDNVLNRTRRETLVCPCGTFTPDVDEEERADG